MITYSVYDPSTRSYDYYQSSQRSGTHTGSPPMWWGRNALGATPEQAAWKVPADAKKIGSGDMPIGRVATIGGSISLGDIDMSSPMTWIVAAALAYVAWKGLR